MKKLIASLILTSVLAFGQGVQNSTLSSPPPTGIQNVSVYTTGVTGGTQYCYFVVAVFNIGMSQPSQPTCIYNSTGTLTGSNFNTVAWQNNPPGGTPIGFWVVRSTSTTFPGTGTTAVNATMIAATVFTQTDQSNTLNAFVYSPSSWAYSTSGVDNVSYGIPVLTVQNGAGAKVDQWPQIAISLPTTTQTKRLVHVSTGTVTVAAINSVVTIMPAYAGIQYEIVSILFYPVGGQPATCTDVHLSPSNDTSTIFVGVPVATLAASTWVNETGANIVFNNFLVPLTTGVGVVLTQSGSTCTTMTSLTYKVEYIMNAGRI
jgi:hypothetical protein